MSEQQPEPSEWESVQPASAHEQPSEPAPQPVTGGADDGPPAQGEGAPDSH